MKHFYRYLPVSEEVRRQSLYVVAGGYTLIPAHSPYPPQHHPSDHHFDWNHGRTLQEYQIIYITRGGGRFESRSAGKRRISAGTLFMLFPGEWHRYSPEPESGWDEYWLAFRGMQAERLAAEYPLTPAQPMLLIGRSEIVMEEFARAAQEMREEQVGYQKVIAAGALKILAVATATSQREAYAGTDVAQVVEAAKRLLRARLDTPMPMEEIASELNVGYCWFRRAFRRYTGLAPAQYHLQLRVNYASELLRATTLTVAVVGQRAGFDSENYFFRLFKKKTGYTPSEYRALSQRGGPETMP